MTTRSLAVAAVMKGPFGMVVDSAVGAGEGFRVGNFVGFRVGDFVRLFVGFKLGPRTVEV